MKKFFFLVITIFSVLPCLAQGKVGLVHYGEIQSMGMGAPVGPDYNALLVFNNLESLYITRQDSLEGRHISEQKSYRTASGKGHSQTNSTNEPGFLFFHDMKDRNLYSRDIGFNYVKEPVPEIKWKITNETKNIGEHKVHKATANFRGRDYTAWFTTDIPFPYGPWKLQGLPGLILEAYDTHKEIYWYFKALEYPTEKSYLLKPIHNKTDWSSLKAQRNRTLEALKNSQVGGRMGAENAGISVKTDSEPDILRFFIENFDDDPARN